MSVAQPSMCDLYGVDARRGLSLGGAPKTAQTPASFCELFRLELQLGTSLTPPPGLVDLTSTSPQSGDLGYRAVAPSGA